MNIKDYITIKEASEVLGVDKTTLRRWDKTGKLKPYRHPLNKYRLYKRAELEALLRGIEQ
ncbi:MAG: helix-turn-helix domain-containing protein [Candidatus Gastranaerophilales bacterium]|nr:helix-turn-helix domain-containing protein [Candidatus Gastranaerophilales bacterium]